MPTPSSDQPPDPPSPHSQLFSSCPDPDELLPARLPWIDPDRADLAENRARHSDRAIQRQQEIVAAVDVAVRHGASIGEETAMVQEHDSAESSTRATSLSPQSSNTALTSPTSSNTDREITKDVVMSLDDHHIGSHQGSLSLHDGRSPEEVSPASVHSDSTDSSDTDDQDLSPTIPDYPTQRSRPIVPSSYLRPGSRFHGTQQSERQVYDVQVEIKHVDMRESFLCGYLRIQGLTEDHPTLTTYFEGEIIGNKYNFFTNHEDWGASHKVDLNHWAKFNAFRPFQKQARRGPVSIPDVAQRENIFMRWKEHFLVPDHRVRTITGASFEGFYYICFNQVQGEVSGIYFHSKSEKFQQLELKHVPDRGCFSAVEFR